MSHTAATQIPYSHENIVVSLVSSQDGALIASGASDGSILLHDAHNYSVVAHWSTHGLIDLAFSPEGTYLAAVTACDTVVIFDITRGGVVATVGGHGGRITCVTWSPDSARLASASWDETLRVWYPHPRDKCLVLERGFPDHRAIINVALFSPDARWLASGGDDRACRLWDYAAGARGQVLEHAECVEALAFDARGAQLAVGCRDGAVDVYVLGGLDDVHGSQLRGETWGRLASLRVHDTPARTLAFGSGRPFQLLSATRESVKVTTLRASLDPPAEDPVSASITLPQHADWVRGAAFSPCSTLIPTCGLDGAVRVLRAPVAESVLEVVAEWEDAHGGAGIKRVLFAQDGKTLASAAMDGTVVLRPSMVSVLALDLLGAVFAPGGDHVEGERSDTGGGIAVDGRRALRLKFGIDEHIREVFERQRGVLGIVTLIAAAAIAGAPAIVAVWTTLHGIITSILSVGFDVTRSPRRSRHRNNVRHLERRQSERGIRILQHELGFSKVGRRDCQRVNAVGIGHIFVAAAVHRSVLVACAAIVAWDTFAPTS